MDAFGCAESVGERNDNIHYITGEVDDWTATHTVDHGDHPARRWKGRVGGTATWLQRDGDGRRSHRNSRRACQLAAEGLGEEGLRAALDAAPRTKCMCYDQFPDRSPSQEARP
jgi:hypothetical protein